MIDQTRVLIFIQKWRTVGPSPILSGSLPEHSLNLNVWSFISDNYYLD